MSADNYVKVRRFGDHDYRWGMWFASEDEPDFSDTQFRSGSFKTPLEAAQNAEDELMAIEYGIEFEPECPKKRLLITLDDESSDALMELVEGMGLPPVELIRKLLLTAQNMPLCPWDLGLTDWPEKRRLKALQSDPDGRAEQADPIPPTEPTPLDRSEG